MRKLTTEIFIEKAKLIHGESKYDYSCVKYEGGSKKVKIICKNHGEFYQTANNHLCGCDCPKCAYIINGINSRNNNFIEDAINLHGNLYDYSLVNYVNNKIKIKIICKYHGVFEQKPNDHLRGLRCFKCFGTIKKTTEDFIMDAIKIHKHKYDYSLVDYKNNKMKVKIICKEHGLFEQVAKSHLNGNGCSKCKSNCKLTIDIFISESIKIHGFKYDYSKVIYTNTHTKSIITCKKHGDFSQKAYKHIQGRGCPKCKNSKGMDKICRLLENNKIKYLTEQTIPNCVSPKGKSLLFDIFIPSLNIYIEYDGEQHFKEVKIWGGEKSYTELKIRDKIKDDFCLNNNITLYRISYKDNIEHEMDKILN